MLLKLLELLLRLVATVTHSTALIHKLRNSLNKYMVGLLQLVSLRGDLVYLCCVVNLPLQLVSLANK